MKGIRLILVILIVCAVGPVSANDRLVRLAVPDALAGTGLFKFLVPRFTLKTQIRVELVAPGEPADAALGDDGRAAFSDADRTWHLEVISADHPGTKRFAEWLTSDIGLKTVTSFAPDGEPLFTAAAAAETATAEISFDGDAALGKKLSKVHCARCHVISEATRMTSIDSTPSFFLLRAFDDWSVRFAAFYALRPHPAFTQIEEVTPPFPKNLPSPIAPLELTLDDVEAILAYVALLPPADLGAPLQHQ